MADIKVDLKAQQEQFVAAMAQATQNVNALTKQLAALSSAQQSSIQSTNRHAAASQNAANASNNYAKAQQGAAGGAGLLASKIGLAVVAFQALYDGVKQVVAVTTEGFKLAVQNIDDFKQATIGTAAAITNIADKSELAGKTWEEVFHQNLKATKETFLDLEKLAAKYFASSTDLQLAYNAFAQRGIVIRRTELEQLAQLTDMILLLTQGQQSSIQVQEEIRSLVNGQLRPTAQLGQLLKSYGKDIKEVAGEIRATQSLRPLEEILRGSAAATKEIQGTFQAVKNGFETTLRQLGRLGFEQFYSQLVNSVQGVTDFLTRNREQIIGLFAVAGKGVSTVLNDIGKAIAGFTNLSNQSATTQSGFVSFIAAVETSVQVMIRSVQVLINLFKLVVDAASEVSSAIDIAFTPSEKIRAFKTLIKDTEEALKQSKARGKELAGRGAPQSFLDANQTQTLDIENGLKKLKTELRAMQEPLGFVYDKTKEMLTGLPWTEGARSFGNALSDIGERFDKAFAPLLKFDVKGDFRKRLEELKGAAIVAETGAQVAATGPHSTTANIGRSFSLNPEQLADAERRTNALIAAQDRLARAERTGGIVEIAADAELRLQELRRTLALVEQGFVAVKDQVIQLRSPLELTFNFMRANADKIVFGDITDGVNGLTASIAQMQKAITGDTFKNLDDQLQVIRKGLADVKQSALDSAAALIKTEVDVPLTDAAAEEADATRLFERRVALAQEMLQKSQQVLETEKASNAANKAARVETAQRNLAQEEFIFLQTIAVEQDRKLSAFAEAAKLRAIADANQSRINAQMDAQIAMQAKRFGEDELRVLQAKNAIVGQILKNSAQLLESTERRLLAEKAKQPRTDLQTGREEINQVKLQFSVDLGQEVGKLSSLSQRLQELGAAATQADAALVTSQAVRVAQIQQTQDEIVAVMTLNNNLRTSVAAIGTAVQQSLDGTLDAILGSFEGKKPNFVGIFKGVADNLVKNSMKDMFDKIKTGFETGLQDLGSLLPKNLQSTLGPAFMAGIGLIASFVLGQLLGDKGGEASAANPQVGIQSTEQIRGLIGGETQIPIGLVGESLQDALVTTNGILMRIALGVESISPGGASFEQSLSDAFGSTLQTQG